MIAQVFLSVWLIRSHESESGGAIVFQLVQYSEVPILHAMEKAVL